MAEAVLEIALENLSSLIQKELGLFLGSDQEFKRLSSTLTAIKATLEDAEERQFTEKAIKDWLRKLKDAAYVLDDILDECATEALEMENGGFMCGLSDKVQSSCLSSFHPKHVVFRRRIAKKMKRISERLDEISDERSRFHLTEMVTQKRAEWRQTTSIIAQPQVYGRDEDKDKIVDFLVGDSSSFEDLAVYPILGLGGLGKTTLAQLIFNHERVVNHFKQRIWVCVSEDFSLKRMTKAIIESASGHACEDLDLDPLQRKLIDLLQGRRYLIVLDDVWDDEQENWLRLKSLLIHGGKGASILVTTRLQKVAAIMGTIPPYELSMLSDDNCWELFKQRAFGPNEVERAELVGIGKEIVKKCGGVPLAAIALGSLLRFKREEKEWLCVKESKLWSLQGENFVMPALRLSYLNLPVKLRQCFSFCALFSKDEIISRQFLIELWMANGLVSSNEMVDAEDIGDELFNELYWRSNFQDIKTDEFGKITSFKMHDLVHDLAQYVAEEVCCSAVNNGIADVSEGIRHLSFYRTASWKQEVSSIQSGRFKSLKTCILGEHGHLFGGRSVEALKSNSLRMLNYHRLGSLSTSIGRFKYLRHLDISSGSFKSLPESLCMLWNLQILKLDNCRYLEKLPASLVRLKALQHLSLIGCYSLSRFPPQMGKLTCLRTLSMYFVGKEEGFQLAELGRLNLKGQLHIKHLEKVKSVIDAQEANMSSKHLNHLQLSWGRNEDCQSQENVEQILEVLQPHTHQLQILAVEGYTGACFPQWMSSLSLKYLNSLKLVDCESCLDLPQLGKLPALKYLGISNTSCEIVYLYEESCADGIFIALESLKLEKMPNLKKLSREDGENMFPRLSELEIIECPQLLGLPCLPSLNSLMMRGKGNQDLLSSIHKFHSLEHLYLGGNKEITCFPNGMLSNLSSLKRLHIFGCSKLEELLPNEVVNLGALQPLDIKHCQSLNSLTDGVLQGLQSLKKLVIVGCHKFNMSAGFQYLTCLEYLVIHGSSEMEGLHEALQHVTALKTLVLCNLPNLECLPAYLGNLGSLQLLAISKCPKLTCIRMSIQSLKMLGIYSCEVLGKRCQAETGEDWSNIAHVQDIVILNSGPLLGISGLSKDEHMAAASFKHNDLEELEAIYSTLMLQQQLLPNN
ncbi:putative disease resistance protein RGA3 [Lotus japonicus]|uniref:putative disease resistance protein RGA3 n=1 Tax=Lotus japonicus TaxID=34305 RepID=UPI002586C896|nr:putative disease resistance protein RGA3 [Lotus japonicus]